MQTFGEQLTAARKEKGMTQDALANAAAVTRQTISSWERGRTVPDIETIRRLSDVLGVDLMRTAEGEGQDAPTSSNVNISRGGVVRRTKKLLIIAGAAALVCVLILFLLLTSRKPAPTGARDTFSIETYQQKTPNEAGKAYITFDNRTWTEGNDDAEYQMYDFTLKEHNGVDFSISRIETEWEGKAGSVRTININAEELQTTINPDMPAYGSVTIDGGFPKGEFSRIGVAVYGKDGNGEPLTFYDLIEF